MADETQVIEALDSRARRREERRDFFRNAGYAATALTAGAAWLGQETRAIAQTTAPTEADTLNFLLNFEYLEANFYAFAVLGAPIAAGLTDGAGTRGAATGGRKVGFVDPQVAQYAREIAADELAHVEFLRLSIGATAIAQPQIDLGTAPNGAFSTLARAAGLVGPGQSFDPYATDDNFLLGAFMFEDVGVTAYKGAVRQITNKALLEAAAGILAVEAHHASIIRTVLYRKGLATPALVAATEAISAARDGLDGASGLDQGIRPIDGASNIAPLGATGIAYSRTAGQVLNIAYLNRLAVSSGGFFPAGVNGTIKTSAAN